MISRHPLEYAARSHANLPAATFTQRIVGKCAGSRQLPKRSKNPPMNHVNYTYTYMYEDSLLPFTLGLRAILVELNHFGGKDQRSGIQSSHDPCMRSTAMSVDALEVRVGPHSTSPESPDFFRATRRLSHMHLSG